jgi:acyl carrier protein
MEGTTLEAVAETVAQVLELGERGKSLEAGTRLFGAMPELDSLAVLELITALEERFGIEFGSEDISAESFGTIGSVVALIDDRLG